LVLDLHTPVHFSVQAVAALAYLTIFGSAIAFLAYYWLLRVIPATRVSLFLYVTPVVAVVLGTLLGHEQLAVQTGIGAVLVFASIALMRMEPKPDRG
jgi:drug/metabolite transporter (DMT)-like permease